MIDARFARYCPGVLGAVLSFVAAGGIGMATGCSSDKSTGAAVAKSPQPVRNENLEHEPCGADGKSTEGLDTNNDGKPDIRTVRDGSGHDKCRTIDLNHDGRTDLYEYLDPAGTIRRREFCYDDTGTVNAVEYYEGGKLVRREYDTTGQHKIDTWDWFDPNAPLDPKTGRPAHPIRRERDTHGDGFVDQWWTWDGAKVSIATDRNADGQPDPASVIQLGGGDDGGAAAAANARGSTRSDDGGVPSGAASTSAQADGGKT